ncbi:hypothetical protein [Undibacterium sp.]|uniref:hypothetical protein n=1 Tax=Undibacterium sp. TaxID=1914977 RepID=UPI0037510482
MRKLFAYPKIPCVRCEHENQRDSDYCTQCGLMLGSPAHDAILRQQRWIPADDEVAIFFSVQSIDKIAMDNFQIPARARAFILQDQRCVELFAGDYDSASLRAKTAHFGTDQALDILITRSLPFALHFHFEDLHTAEFLAMRARCLVRIKIDQVLTFAHHFMAAPGSINTAQLQDLLSATVKQSLQSWLSIQTLRNIQDQADLAAQLDAHLLTDLHLHLTHYGLAATQAIVQELRHEKLSSEREKLSEQSISTSLQMEAQRAQLEQAKNASTLYSELEWQKIAKQEEQVRLRYRHEEMRQQFGKDLGWLYLQGEHEKAKKRLSRAKLQQDEAERLQTIRLREVDLYRQIAEAHTRQQALKQETADTIRGLEHTLKEKSEARQNEADQWLHIRTLARIKMRSETELSQLHCKQTAQVLQQQIAQQIQQIQLEHQIAQSRLISDQEQQTQQAQLLREKQARLEQREQELEDERQKNRLIHVSIETEVRAREFQRMQAWEEELHQQRSRDLHREERIKESGTELKVAQVQTDINRLQRESELAHAVIQQEKLMRTLEVHQRLEQQEQQKAMQAVEIEKSRMQISQEEEQSHWQRQQQTTSAEQQQQIAMAKMEIERLSAIANFSETGKIATAEVPNASALAEVMKLQTQASMSAEQILAAQAGQSMHAAQAMSAMAQVQQGMSLEQAMKMLQERLREEREQREVELQRRHQIDLNMVQNLGQQRTYSQPNGRK